jgi:hypothetical protein
VYTIKKRKKKKPKNHKLPKFVRLWWFEKKFWNYNMVNHAFHSYKLFMFICSWTGWNEHIYLKPYSELIMVCVHETFKSNKFGVFYGYVLVYLLLEISRLIDTFISKLHKEFKGYFVSHMKYRFQNQIRKIGRNIIANWAYVGNNFFENVRRADLTLSMNKINLLD